MTTAIHIQLGVRRRPVASFTAATLVAASTALTAAGPPTAFLTGDASTVAAPRAVAGPRAVSPQLRPRRAAPPRVVRIAYTAHNGVRRDAVVLLPAGYRRSDGPLPLVISPHGRGATGAMNAEFWGNLPTVGRFAVVNPDGMGRRLPNLSYGFRAQIDDLARMPRIVEQALPAVVIDRSRIYALGSSMGGQETLLLVAHHPQFLAGAAAMDSVTDLARRYRQLPSMRSSKSYLQRVGTPKGIALQSMMRAEVGGTPSSAPRAYAARSASSLARRIARSGVPLQIWWSSKDRIVFDQEHQSAALFRTLRSLGTDAPVVAYAGRWAHSTEMRSTALLPLALIEFGLLPRTSAQVPASVSRIGFAG